MMVTQSLTRSVREGSKAGREDLPGNHTAECEVRLPNSSLRPEWQSGFLESCVYELLRELNDARPYGTTVSVRVGTGWSKLRQFLHLSSRKGGVLLRASGPLASQLCERLPRTARERLSQISFDSDGYAYALP